MSDTKISHSPTYSAGAIQSRVKMATDAYNDLKGLDEFFDFDAAHEACREGDGFIASSENVMVMDWQPTIIGESTVLPQSQKLMSHDDHTHQSSQDITACHSLQQWSPVQTSSPSLALPYGEIALQTWPMGSPDAIPDSFPYIEVYPGPSRLSNVPAHDHLMILCTDDREGVADTSNLQPSSVSSHSRQQGLEGSGQAHVETTPDPSQVRPSGPLRQDSTSSLKPASAKRKGPQNRIPLEAKQILEDEFVANPYPCSWEMDIIAHQANLEVKKVRNWFNNRRARKKEGE